MSVVDDYAYIPTTWRAKAGGPDEDGVPTSYYTAVHLTCHAEIVDDTQAKAEFLRRQLAHFQPRSDHAQAGVDMPPYGRMLSGIRGLRLHIASVAAKFKYDDHNPPEHRARVAERLESRRTGRDRSAAASNAGASRKSANGNPPLTAAPQSLRISAEGLVGSPDGPPRHRVRNGPGACFAGLYGPSRGLPEGCICGASR